MFDRGLFLTLQAIRRQLAAMPHELYLIRLIHHATGRPFPGERLWTADQLTNLATIRFLRVRNREGCDVYIQPYAAGPKRRLYPRRPGSCPAGRPATMRANGHEPCVVLQTSPGHLQAWVHVSPTPFGTCCSRRPSASTWRVSMEATWPVPTGVIWADSPASPIRSPQRRTPGGYAPWVKIVHTAVLAWRVAPKLCRSRHPSAPSSRSHARLGNRSACAAIEHSPTPASLAAAEARQIYQSWMSDGRLRDAFRSRTGASWICGWLAQLLAQGVSGTRPSHSAAGEPAISPPPRDPDDYLRRTLARAFSPFPRLARCVPLIPAASTAAAGDSECSNSTGGR